MRDYHILKVNLPGGIVSPGRLRDILSIALTARVQYARFGARQQLLFTVTGEKLRFLERDFTTHGIPYEVNAEQHPNIISSYCAEEVFRTGQWLSESEYHTVLDDFDYQPVLKVNLSDSNQSFTPFFTGNLNFIASPEPHFWYLYIRPKQTNTLFRWRDLIYTNDIARIAHRLEEVMLSDENHLLSEAELYELVYEGTTFITQPATEEVELPDFTLPYYEGFNRYGQRTWLGLYRRNEQFSIPFLIDLCALCLETRVGELCTTPWKSLIIKGIEEKDRTKWSAVLGRHNINVRHAASELAWQTEDHSEEGIDLKKYILRYLEKMDTRTFGLCFGIQTRPKSEVFGSILIRKRPMLRIGKLGMLPVYDLYFTENFNPNSRSWFLFEKGLMKNHLPHQVERLCRKFNASRNALATKTFRVEPIENPVSVSNQEEMYQCPHCLTQYDAVYGDERAGIQSGTSFGDLPESYVCSTCETPKADFVPVIAGALLV